MALSLQRLISTRLFNVLQEKLEGWSDAYKFNSTDQNIASCCEIIELNAKIQGHLFKLLSVCAAGGGIYGDAHDIKQRLLPLLGTGFFASGLSSDTSLSIIADTAGRNKLELQHMRVSCENSLLSLENDLNRTRAENESLRVELDDERMEIHRQNRASATDTMFNDTEIKELRTKLEHIKGENRELRSDKLYTEKNYEHQISHMKQQLYAHSRPESCCAHAKCVCGANGLNSEQQPHSKHVGNTQKASDEESQIAAYERNDRYRDMDTLERGDCSRKLVHRFNNLFSQSRLVAMTILNRYCDDVRNNQRIIYYTMVESFYAAKTAFRSYKHRIRNQLAISLGGSGRIEKELDCFLSRNSLRYALDLFAEQKNVCNALNRRTYINFHRPPGLVNFDVIGEFIRSMPAILGYVVFKKSD